MLKYLNMADDRTAPDLARLLHQLRRREARRRGAQELTYRELAARTGWSLGIVAQYFSGKSVPPIDRFDVLVRLLGATPTEQGTLATLRDRVAESRRRVSVAQSTEPRFRLLGPVEVIGSYGAARLVGARQRAVVALLALSPGRVLSQTRLIDALWGEDPPRTAVKTLYSHVARIRRAFAACGLPGVLNTEGSGYLLAIRPEDVDAFRLERRVAQARKAIGAESGQEAVAHLCDGLALWRGDALADAPVHCWGAAEVDRLHEVWLGAQEDLWEARLGLGEHAGASGEIEKLLVVRPGRERLVELLMISLYRCGRPNEAIEAYQRLRHHLDEHLGVEPGERVRGLYTKILRRDTDLDPPRSTARMGAGPAQLPPAAGHFTGRAAELAVLDGLVGPEPRVGVVCGPAGMGKTALAVQWAGRAAGRYPDGQLFIDLRGHDPASALPVPEALAYLLAGLGVPAAEIPADPIAQLGLYRSALHRRRVLVLLDNAASADQVAPLVPPAPSLLLVTSRKHLIGLAVHHAVSTVDLDVLRADDSLALLKRVLGADRVAAELAPARRLVELCGRMPLALRIAAAKLAAGPEARISDLAAHLAGSGRLDALSVPGDSHSVRKAFSGAYQALSKPAARLFRRLGAHPGPSFTPALAAALAEISSDQVRAALDELIAAHLVAHADPHRYRFHDLIGVYAHECAEPGEAARSEARVIDWYLTVGDAANRIFSPARDRAGPVETDPRIEPPFAAEHEAALEFLDSELPNLLPVVRLAAEHGDDRAAWRLAYLLVGFLTLRGHSGPRVEMCRLGLAAAQRVGDPTAEAVTCSLLGLACHATHAYEEAVEHFEAALALMRRTGDLRGQGMALNNIAFAQGQLGRFDAAMRSFQQVLDLSTANEDEPDVATALNNIGHVHIQLGRPDLAREHLGRALALIRRLGLPRHEAYSLMSLGEAYRADTDLEGALAHFTAALTIRRRLGERRLEADTLNLIGLTHHDRGDHGAAAAHFQQALMLARELGDRHLEETVILYLDRSRGIDGDNRDPVDDDALGDAGQPYVEPASGRARRAG